jgi:patatin-like phospholipase/acyl hydrolase
MDDPVNEPVSASETAATPGSAPTPLCGRDRHLFGGGPKRILSLDGGGVRGAVSVAFLEQIEKVLTEKLKKKVRLGDYFDLIGGTSTGSIISAALALGYSVQDIKKFYLELAPIVFRRSYWRVQGLQAKFDAAALRREIEDALGGHCNLGSEDLITGLCVVSKRMDTGSPWIMSNNPRAPYWTTGPVDPATGRKGYTGNEHYKLANLVRASTAAPFYFDRNCPGSAG